jgi:hypothetical protein
VSSWLLATLEHQQTKTKTLQLTALPVQVVDIGGGTNSWHIKNAQQQHEKE